MFWALELKSSCSYLYRACTQLAQSVYTGMETYAQVRADGKSVLISLVVQTLVKCLFSSRTSVRQA